MDLTEFLLARIADDEERAEFVRKQNEGPWNVAYEPWRLSWMDEYDLLCIEPLRALAECEARRRIVAECEAMGDAGDILRALSLPYADHPDYQPEWKP